MSKSVGVAPMSARTITALCASKRGATAKVLACRPAADWSAAARARAFVQLSERTIGVTVKDDREWTEARIRAAHSTDGDAI
jgi:hypothetical protein